MWASHHRHLWADLDAREEPRDAGRALYVGGFILADPFDTQLRLLSEEYLAAAWDRVYRLMRRYEVEASDLSWGWMHPGETYVPNGWPDAPTDYTGWTSRQLQDFYRDPRYPTLDRELEQGVPSLRCTCTWRSLKWRIAPKEFGLGLRLCEALATDEVADWSPAYLLTSGYDPADLWVRVAQAVEDRNQGRLDEVLEEARQQYSAVGYRIVVRGFRLFVNDWKIPLQLPVV